MHTRDLTRFLAELAENNNRPWFVMNKPRYDILREEFLELVTQLVAGTAKFDKNVANCNPKKALFRINRDIRFANDKSPYKTVFSGAVRPDGRKKPSDGGGPSYYFEVNHEGKLFFAAGEYMPPSHRLRAIRDHVIADPKGFSKAIKDKKLIATFGGLQEGDKLTRPPKGFSAEEPMIEFVKLRHFIVWNEIDLKPAYPTDLAPMVLAAFKDAYPLVNWLRGVPEDFE